MQLDTPDTSITSYEFNNELLQLLCEEDNINNKDCKVCLISNTELIDNSVKLRCGHQFNYDDIFDEIKYQKKQHHHNETQKLSNTQIKCPYCRTIQNGLLPWYKGKNKCTGVNWPAKYQYKPNKCVYTYLSGKRKGSPCDKPCMNKYCTNHEKIMKIRLEKQKDKKKKNTQENIKNFVNNTFIQQQSNVIISNTCGYVFKRGKNKGVQCSCKKIYKEGLCKQHHKQTKLKLEKELNKVTQKIQNINTEINNLFVQSETQNVIIEIADTVFPL
jgi:hypothetical protein